MLNLLGAICALGTSVYTTGHCQIPVVNGKSTTRSGMIYYDANLAEDKRDRIYCYTVCPDSAGCIYLDFNLIRSSQTASSQVEGPSDGDQGKGVDFVRLYDGASPTAPLIGSFGTTLGTQFIQSSAGCITLEFTRDAAGLDAIWTVMWRSKATTECIRPFEANPCANVQDICGPAFHENFHYFGQQSHSPSPPRSACVDQPHNATWYKFAIAQAGKLQFEIIPDNGLDDFDWVLIKADTKTPGECPKLPDAKARLACNSAAGRGHAGATGMDGRGQAFQVGSAGSPYCQPVSVEKGDLFYLFIDDYSQHSSGFSIRFNDVVMQCSNPHKDFLRIAHDQHPGPASVDPRKSFSKYTRVLRIDLAEKANLPLAQSLLPAHLYDLTRGTESKLLDADPSFSHDRGMVAALVNGLKLGRIRAYAAHDFQSPVHYGDLLELPMRNRQDSSATWRNWWNPGKEDMDSYMQVMELIVDEVFDKISGIKRQRIRFIRLLWTDRDGKAPDYNVAVFNYEEVRNLLDQIPLDNRHNDAQQLTAKDFLETQLYQAVMVERSAKSLTSLQQSKFTGDQQVELESFIWER